MKTEPTVLWHQPRERQFEFAAGEPDTIEIVTRHIERHVGPIFMVYHEIVSDLVHVDLHWVQPSEVHPFHTLVTTGMSDRPMHAPPGEEAHRFSELVIHLPPDWPMGQDDWKDEKNYWPIRLIKSVARLPHEYATWLWVGHTVGGGADPEAYHSSTGLCTTMLMPCVSLPTAFAEVEVTQDKAVHFFSLVPLYKEELALKLRKGTNALLDRLDRAGIDDVIRPSRRNTCAGPRWPFPWLRA